MKNLFYTLFLCALLPSAALAQSSFEVVRNDNGTNVVQATNGKRAKISVDSNGRLIPATSTATTAALAKSGTLAGTSVLFASYTTIVTNSVDKGVILDCYNGTDKDVVISVNASTPFIYIPTLLGKVIPLGDNGKHITSNISVKALTANATSGSVLCTLIY